MMNIEERFLNYVSIDTQSDECSHTSPSTKKQLNLARVLVDEMKELGLQNVELNEYGIVYGTIAGNGGTGDIIGFIAHMDTSPATSGAYVKPQKITHYDGQIITLNQELNLKLDPQEFKELNKLIGHDLITTDGTTLLGADDKAGIAIIMDFARYLTEHPEIKHNDIQIAFTPDEEVGRGTEHFDVERFHAKYAYTLDGGDIEKYSYQTFNAYSATVEIYGKSIHPGTAKGKMINAATVAMEFDALLPTFARPEYTEDYEGFNHLHHIDGNCEYTTMQYIIRNHDIQLLYKQIDDFKNAQTFLNKKYGYSLIKLTLHESYRNMAEIILKHFDIIKNLEKAMKSVGIDPISEVTRGGTDGAMLTFQNLPCPNIGTGGANFHGPFEYVSLTSMKKAVDILVELVKES